MGHTGAVADEEPASVYSTITPELDSQYEIPHVSLRALYCRSNMIDFLKLYNYQHDILYIEGEKANWCDFMLLP